MVITHQNQFIRFTLNGVALVVCVNQPTPTKEEWEWTKQTMGNYYEAFSLQRSRISIIFDLRKLGLCNLNIYRDWVGIFKKYQDDTRKYIYKTSVITDSRIIKIILNGVFKIYTSIRPMKFTSNMYEAEQFIKVIM